MTGKLNWDRVRKENLMRSHGSAWTPSVVELDRWKNEGKKKKKKTRKRKGHLAGWPMPGCTCGKPVGFSGSHKKRCPLFTPHGVPRTELRLELPQTKIVTEDEKWILTHPPKNRPLPTLKELAAAIKAIGRKAAVRDALSGHIGDPDGPPPRMERQAKVAERIIAALLKELED